MPPPATLTPYVPRSLMTDLNHESNPDRSSVSLKRLTAAATSSSVAKTTPSSGNDKKNRLTNNDNRRNKSLSSSSLMSPTASSRRPSSNVPSKRLTSGTKDRSFPLNSSKKTPVTTATRTERTASSTESSSLSNNVKVSRRRRESGLTPPLTCRKPMKRGRDSTGSIVLHMTDSTCNDNGDKDSDDVFDLKLLDSILDGNSSLNDDSLSQSGSLSTSSNSVEAAVSHPKQGQEHPQNYNGTKGQEYLQDLLELSLQRDVDNHDDIDVDVDDDDDDKNGQGIMSPQVPSADKSSSMGGSSIRSHLMHCDFSSLISDDADNDSDDHDGDDDTTTTESGNSWSGIMMKLGQNLHGGGVNFMHEQDVDEDEGTASSLSQDGALRHLDLLLTPDIMQNDDLLSGSGTVSVDASKKHGGDAMERGVDQSSCHDTPKRQQPKSFSDTETMHFVSHQKLQDILARGGEKALDAALDALMERVDSDTSDFNSCNNTGNSDVMMKHNQTDGGLGVRSFHSSFIQNGSSLDNLYLRSSLKSALIALGSVKAERSDLESNFAKLQLYCQDMKNSYEEKLKQLMVENSHDESCKYEIANTDAAALNSNEEKVDLEETKAQLEQAHLDLEMQRIQIETLQKDLQQTTQQRIEATALQERLDELETKFDVKSKENHELSTLVDGLRLDLQSREQEEVYLKQKLKEKDDKCSVLESRLAHLEEEMQQSEKHSFEKIRLLEERLHKNQQIQSETDDLMQRLETICGQLSSVQDELVKSNELNFSLKQKLSIYERENDLICAQLDDFNIRCNSPMVDRIKFLIDNLESSKQQVHQKESVLQDLSKKLSESLETIQKLDSELKQLALDLDHKNKDLQKWIDLNASLADENKDMRDRIDSINGEYAIKSLQREEKIEELQVKLVEAEDYLCFIKNDLRARDSIISDLQTELDDAKQEIKSRSNQGEVLERDTETMMKALQEANQKITRLEEEVVTKNMIMKEIRSSSEKEVEDLKMKLLETESKVTLMQDRQQSDECKLNEKICMIDNLTLELEALKASSASEVKQLIEDIREIESVKKCLEDELRAKDVAINELQLSIEKWTLSVHSKEKDLEVLQSSLDEAKSELILLRNELDVPLKQAESGNSSEQIMSPEKNHVKSKEQVRSALEMEIDLVKIESTDMDELYREGINSQLKELQETKKSLENYSQELREKDDLITLLKNNISDLNAELNARKIDKPQEQNLNNRSAEIDRGSSLDKHIEHTNAENAPLNEGLNESEIYDIHQLRNEVVNLKQTIDSKEVEIENIRRERMLSELEFLNSQRDNTGHIYCDNLTSNGVGESLNVKISDEADAKEAVRELIGELNAAITEKNSALSDLNRAHSEIERMKDLCNQRELEACALESSLQKALMMADNTDSDQIINDEMRKVIEELVHEIARFKDNLPSKICNGNDVAMPALSRELAILEQELAHQNERAAIAEDSLLRHREEYEQVILKLDELSLCFYDIMRQSNEDIPNIQQNSDPVPNKLSLLMRRFEFILDTWKEKFSKTSTGTLSCCSASESNEELDNGNITNPESSAGMHAETNSFAVTLNDMITHSNEVIQNVLNEFSSDSSMASETEVHNLVTANVHMVEYSVFESLRLKYDALVEEREELINETFALIDSSKAANAAELQALKGRVENETNMQFASYMQEATTRIEYLETRLASCTCSS